MRLFAKPKLKNEERRRCLAYHDEQLRVAAFLCKEDGLLESVFRTHWDAMTKSAVAARHVCRAADRFRQAAEETLRRHAAIGSVPDEASRLYAALSTYLSYISAWTKVNLTIMETLAQGKPPFYVTSERLKDHARSVWGQAQETYRAFRRGLGLPADEANILETALRTCDFETAGTDDWRPEPYTRDFSQTLNRILSRQDEEPRPAADTMTHNPPSQTDVPTNENKDSRPEVPQADPQDAGAWFNKGVSLAALGRYEEAIACYDQALAIDPLDGAAWFNKGVNLAALDRREEAVECFDQAVRIDPRDETAWCAKGVNLAALDRREEAIACWDRALQINTHCVGAWCAKGVSLATADRRQEAIACFDEALKIDSRLARVWSNKGDCLTALGRHEEAIVCCDAALEIDPRDDAAWYNKAVGLAALARHQEAVACFDRALSIDPILAPAWSKKGNSLVLLRRFEEAIVCYARAVRIDPRDAAAWYNKALREEVCGRREDAAKSYRQFVEVAPPERAELIAAAKRKIEELSNSVEAEPALVACDP